MTADAAYVAAVAEAREQHETWWSFVWQTFKCRGCDWRDDDPARRDEHLATVAVETLTPLIRAQVAAEIRATLDTTREAWTSQGTGYRNAHLDGLRAAARIAEGAA